MSELAVVSRLLLGWCTTGSDWFAKTDWRSEMRALGVPTSAYEIVDQARIRFLAADRPDHLWAFRLLLPPSRVTTPFWLDVSPMDSDMAYLT